MRADELRQILVLANEFKEGDLLVGGTRDDSIREDARRSLLSTRLGEIFQTPIVEDGLTEALARSANHDLRAQLANFTVADLKRFLLGSDSLGYRDGLSSEVIAAVVKV